jgi:ParB family chromosome partitioning protein
MNVPVAALKPRAKNPRLSLGDLDGLVESILKHGILEPLVVVPDGAKYIVVAGHRRAAAAKRAGLTEVPVVLQELDELGMEEVAIAENVHRRDLTPIELGVVLASLMKTRHLNQRQVGELLNLHQVTVSKKLALLRLPKEIIDQVHEGTLTEGEALGFEHERRGAPTRHNVSKPGPKIKRCRFADHDGHRCEIALSRESESVA